MRRRRPMPPDVFERARADLNVTPLVDVMLVLLVIFMVTAPMLAAGFHVDLPKARAAAPLPTPVAVIVAIGADGRLTVDGEETTAERIAEAVAAHLGEDRSRPIRLRADGSAPYRLVVGVLDALAVGGANRIGLVTSAVPPAPQGARDGAAP
ncbi:MAG: biopolymer transporter ExbD [Phyllobacteriaceae bacterium]|nr:biopolymer transporter ExbD [Phyllobacteriaceae bacterium]